MASTSLRKTMRNDSVVMSAADARQIPRVLESLAMEVTPDPALGTRLGGIAMRCSREGTVVDLSVIQPAHWAAVADVRKDLVVVAVAPASVLRPWRRSRETALRDAVIETLRQFEWTAPPGGANSDSLG